MNLSFNLVKSVRVARKIVLLFTFAFLAASTSRAVTSGTIQAESFNAQNSTATENTGDTGGGQDVGYIQNGSWLRFDGIDFGTGASTVMTFAARVATATSGGKIEIRLDSNTGTLLGTVAVANTGGWQTWVTTTPIQLLAATGTHSLYLVFTSGSGWLFNFNWFSLTPVVSAPTSGVIQAESFNAQNSTATENTADTGGGQDVGYIQNGSWLRFDGINFGSGASTVMTFAARVATATSGGNIEVRLDSNTGTLLGTVAVANTGGWQTWVTTTPIQLAAATGTHSLYLVFTSGSGWLFNLNWFSLTPVVSAPTSGVIQAESFNAQNSTATEMTTDTGGGQDIGNIQNGSWLRFDGINFGTGTSSTTFSARVATASGGGNIEVRLDSNTGTLLGTVAVANTGGWQAWVTNVISLRPASGTHSVFLVFTGGGGWLLNINWFSLAPEYTVPAAPTNLGSIGGPGSVNLGWTASASATNYAILRASSSAGPFAQIATVLASTLYTDNTAVNGTTYYYQVAGVNGLGQGAVSNTIAASGFDQNALAAFSVHLRAYNSYGMAWGDLGGVVRLTHWNNLKGPVMTGETSTMTGALNHLGGSLPGVTVNFTAGTSTSTLTPAIYDSVGTLSAYAESYAGNDLNLFSTVFDQYNGTPSTLTVTGIPYASYDAIFYLASDSTNASTRGGSITANGVTKYSRSGLGNPATNGIGYVESTATSASGATTMQGNYIRFKGLTGNLNASIVAINCGDATQRYRLAGFQIVSNSAVQSPTVTAAPSAPANLSASSGNAQVALRWDAAATATSYNVKRNGTTIATVTTPWLDSPTSYMDLTATNGTSYTYNVSAVNSIGEGANSGAASATPALPSYVPYTTLEWQYSVLVKPVQSEYSVTVTGNPDRRAYLWIPPAVTLIRGVIFNVHNMIERGLWQNPVFRQACADAGFGIVWITPSSDLANMDLASDPNLGPLPVSGDRNAQCAVEMARVLDDLAVESGYTELHYAPLIISAHSACSPFCWINGIYSKPALAGRVAGLMPYKGYYPSGAPIGIPTLHVSSEWSEIATWGTTWERNDEKFMRGLRGQSANALLGEFVEVGEGHYGAAVDPTTGPASVLGLFVKKVSQYRIPANWSGTSLPTLNTIDPTTGALLDVRSIGSGNCAPVSYSSWTAAGNDPLRAHWYLDTAMAQAVADYVNLRFGKKPQFLDLIQNDGTVARLDPPATSGGAPLIYPVLDSGDGATFRIRATYLNQSPTFQNFNAGPMSFSGQPVLLRVASGGLRQVGPDTFQIFRDRIGSNDPPVVMAYQLGDANYRGADRPIQIGHQTTLTSGTPQTVSFPTIPNQVATNLQPVTLSATATSGRPVQYWMVSGPYLIAGGTSVLTPTTPPTRATYPMRVIVGAYQWGTTNAPAVASAPTVYQSFWLYKDAAQQTQYQSSAAASASVTRSATAKAKTTGSSANAAASASASRLAGSYTSLLISPDGTSGKLSLRLRANGAVSGKITTVAGSASFTGKLDATGHLMLSVPNSPLGAITIDVRGGIDSGLQVLSGTVKLADGSYELEPAARAVTATEAGLRPGRYSLTFEPDATQIGSPQTNGWGTASLLASGAMTITGTLADGTAYSVSTQVQADGKAPIYFAPGKLTSGLFGLLQTHDSSPEITGQLTWMKLPATRGPYRDGFVAQISASADTSSPTKQR